MPVRFMQDGVCIINSDRRFVWVNEAFERLLGSSTDRIVGTDCCCDDIVECRDEYERPLNGFLCPVQPILNGEQPSVRQRMQIRRPDGSRLWIETIYSRMALNGQGDYVVGVARDVTESVEREHDMVRVVDELRRQGPQHGGIPASGARTAPQPPDTNMKLDESLARMERDVILRALESAGWHRNKAARLMGISRSRLYRRMEALGIDPNVRP